MTKTIKSVQNKDVKIINMDLGGFAIAKVNRVNTNFSPPGDRVSIHLSWDMEMVSRRRRRRATSNLKATDRTQDWLDWRTTIRVRHGKTTTTALDFNV